MLVVLGAGSERQGTSDAAMRHQKKLELTLNSEGSIDTARAISDELYDSLGIGYTPTERKRRIVT